MIHTPSESFEAHDNVASIFAEPDAASITIPDAHLLFTAAFQRKGSDLVLTGDDGHKILVADYFRHEKQPDLVSSEGALLSSSLVELLAGSATPGQYAQAAAPAAQQPIGRVETVSGSATVTRNGVAVDLNVGDLVFQGDVVQTRSDSTLGIGFSDGSAFSLKENARMALNEFVYDPNSTSNSALINLVQGTVSFIASQVAKTGNMRVETPTATLGIRGTFVTVDVSSVDGHTVASLGLETNATTGEQYAGAFTLTNRITGNQVTVNSVNSMFSVSPNGTIGESAKPLAMQAIEQASFHALSAIAAATAASMGTAPTGPTQFLNDPNSPSGTKGGDPASSSGPAPGGSSGANTAPTNTSPTDNHPTTITLTTTTTTDTHPNTTTATTVVQTTTTTTADTHPNTTTATTVVQTTPQGPPTPPTVLTTATNTSTVPTTHTADTTPAAAPPPTITITSIAGGNVINNATAAGGFMISGTETNADGQAVTVKIVDGSGNVNGILTTTASAGAWSVNVSPTLAQALADGAHTFQATVTDQNGNTSNTASQSVTVHETLPAIAIAQVDGNGMINAANAHAGVTISGTESSADGQTITVKVLDSHNNVVDTLTTVASGGSWSATLSSAQAQALADGSYTVQATVTDQYGNPSNAASQSVTVEQQPTVTTPTITGNDPAGSSTVREGDVLTAAASGHSDDTITYAWYSSADGFKTAIGTGTTYTVKEGDEGFKIEVVATSTNDSGANITATSAATATVLDAKPTVTTPTITSNDANGSSVVRESDVLTASATAGHSDNTVSYTWYYANDLNHAIGTGATYTVKEGDETSQIVVKATATNDDSSASTSATSAATATVTDKAPSITVAINGTAQEGQTLSAVVSGAESDDALTYQWQSSSDGTHWSNIANATSSSYAVQEGDEGNQLKVIVTDTADNNGGTATANATTSGTVTDKAPSITVAINGTAQEGQTLSAVVSGAESDDALTYQWQSSSDGTHWSNIANATSSSYAVQEGDEGNQLKVIVTDTADNNGGTATANATSGTVTDITPTLSVTVSGTAQEGQTLTANAVANDSDAMFAYQWQSSSDGGTTWSPISGATDKFYLVAESDEAHLLRVMVTSTDGDSNQGVNGGTTANSAATAQVTDVTPTLTVPFSYAADELKIVKNGTQIYDNTFAQAPPQSPDILKSGVPTPIEFITSGTWSEVDGKAIMSASGDVTAVNINNVTGVNVNALLNTNIDPTSTIGLKQGADFTVSAKFDLASPSVNSSFYGLRLTDQSATHAADQVVEIGIVKSSGTVQVSFLQENFSTHTFTVLASQAFTAGQLSGNTQIEFDLAHVANATAITGSFELINGNTVTSSTTFSDSGQQGQIFTDGVNWTRAGIGSFSPSVVTISGAAKEGQTLAANAATNDADATIHYQWQKSTDNFAHVQTIGTDSSSYVVQEADEGAKIHVVVTTSDSDNTSRASVSVTSAATGTVGDITLAFSTAASISGAATAKEGTALTAVNGTLNDPDASIPITYQWQSASTVNGTYSDIANATSSTYTPVEGDEGKVLHVVETATDSDGGPAITSTSAATSAVADITPALSGVSISGTAQEGQTLTANGTVNDSDATIGYQWQSSSDGTHWSNIANATVATYVVQGGDEGSQIRVVETASDTDNSGFTTSVTSAATGAVIDETPSITVSISGTAQEGQTLHAVVSGFEGDDALSYQWQSSSDGGQTWSDIANATAASYGVQQGDQGHQLQIIVTDVADDNGGTATASAATYVGAQQDDWNTAASGSWGTGANWSNGVPTSSIDALVNATGAAYTVSLVSAAVANSLVIDSSNATVADDSGNSLTITGALTLDAGSISLTGGTIQAGSIDLESSATMLGYGTVSGPITNSGLIEAQSSHTLDISGNISGTGSIEVLNHATLEVDGSVASTQTLSFTGGNGATGTLALDHSLTQPFSAVISGLGQNDNIDLKDLTFTTSGDMTATTSFSSASGHTTLVVTQISTAQHVTFTLAGDYTSSTWNFAQESTGTGTVFHDPPATAADAATVPGSASPDLAQTVTAALNMQSATADQFTFHADSQSGALAVDPTLAASGANATDAATLDPTSNASSDHQPTAPATTAADTPPASNVAATSQQPTGDTTNTSAQTGATTQTAVAPAAIGPNGSDTFVFAANFGNATISNFHPATDVIEIDHTVIANFQALLTAAQDDGHGNAVITADPHDTITIKNVTVAQLVQHQSDFHFT